MAGIDQVDGVKPPPTTGNQTRTPATTAIHADDHLNRTTDVAPPLHVSSTFRYEDDPETLKPVSQWEVREMSVHHTDRAQLMTVVTGL